MNSTTNFLILIADPVLEQAIELQTILNEEGYSFQTATSRKEILDICHTQAPSLFI
ncbi:MAG: hypothetical protein LUD02_00390 [Tannerellaceae bacterium]|nr:hypothetical protein [Tannerellaceae bacterium]